jgi:subtilisin family serine protease
MKKVIVSIIIVLTSFASLGQKAELNWYNKSPKADKVYGTGADKAYELLKDKKAQEVIVAVIDSGVEVDHPDLKDVIWINKDEVPGNGVDDDNNGYIDDVHGWSFLGGATEDINHESMEIARMYHAAKLKFEGKDVSAFSSGEKEEYKKYQDLKTAFDQEQGTLIEQYQGIKMFSDYMNNVKAASNTEFSKKANKAYVPKDEIEAKMQNRMNLILALVDAKELDQQVSGSADQIGNIIKYNEMNTDSIRRTVVGDDPNDVANRIYGCNRYEGPDAMH